MYRIAIIGSRGIPVIYSGFESFCEELSTRLVRKGYKVTVYCRSPYVRKNKRYYKGVRLVTLPAIKNKNFESFSHSLLATLHFIIFNKYDFVYYLGVGNALFCILPKIFGAKTIINVDGLDWKREKWGFLAKLYLSLSSYLSTILADVVVTDSLFMKQYYERQYNIKTWYIPYGYLKAKISHSLGILERYGLRRRKYLVWAGRLVPENRLKELIHAFKKLKTQFKCVIIGDDQYNGKYKKDVQTLAADDKRIIFTGFLNRPEYSTLLRNSFAYIETKRSGGSHPSLIEAMGFGCVIFSNDNSANKEVLGDYAVFYSLKFPREDLRKKLERYLKGKMRKETESLKSSAQLRARQLFSWERIIESYDRLFRELSL